jgi:hypothetical protein
MEVRLRALLGIAHLEDAGLPAVPTIAALPSDADD